MIYVNSLHVGILDYCVALQEEPVDRSKHWGDLEEEEEEEEEQEEEEPMEDEDMEEGMQSVDTISRCYHIPLLIDLLSFVRDTELGLDASF